MVVYQSMLFIFFAANPAVKTKKMVRIFGQCLNHDFNKI